MRSVPIPPDHELRRSQEGRDFRCQRCWSRYPKTDLHIEAYTNLRVCSNCTYVVNEVQAQLIIADVKAEAADAIAYYANLFAEDTAKGLPIPNIFADMQGITSFNPASLALAPGGPTLPLVLTGIGFVLGDVLTFDDAAITATAPVVTFGGTVSTFQVTASGAARRGHHDLYLDGTHLDYSAVVTP
jgi:hypothetical protein